MVTVAVRVSRKRDAILSIVTTYPRNNVTTYPRDNVTLLRDMFHDFVARITLPKAAVTRNNFSCNISRKERNCCKLHA